MSVKHIKQRLEDRFKPGRTLPVGTALAPSGTNPSPDCADREIADGTPEPLKRALIELLGSDKVLTNVSDLVRYASDASPYRFVPQAVVIPKTTEDIAALFRFAHEHGRHLVFRAAGTSLNGQAQAEDILVDVRRHFVGIDMLPDNRRVRIQPGTTIAGANVALARHKRSMGPDPASAVACTVGGVVANNASGMTAGTTRNSYSLLESVTLVLPSGTVVDTADPDADSALLGSDPELCSRLISLKSEIESDADLVALIRSKYAIKNTNGYRLDAFLDGMTPVQILRGLAVGSQGTLGFIAETVFDTVALQRHRSAALVFFADLYSAAAAVPAFNEIGAIAVELMDGNTLRACAAVEGVPSDWGELPRSTTALLVEFRESEANDLDGREQAAMTLLETLEVITPVSSATNSFTRDAREVHTLWKAREAFVSAVGKARPPGTTLITEDFAVPPSSLAQACEALLELQSKHGFDAAVAGHAAHGNLHFLLAFDAADALDVERYAAFMEEFCSMVVGTFHGSLKAEHATGRNIAPFVELEWGQRATDIMWRLKKTIDPHGILAPRVVLDRDPRAHLRGLKTIPVGGEIGDDCIECGFCEPVCPSRDLTTSPRQRIVLRREILRQPAASPVAANLLDTYGYQAVDTCAGDGACKLACPVGIDTGALMKQFRAARHTSFSERIALTAANRFGAAERGARTVLRLATAVGDRPMGTATRLLRRISNPELIPEWLPELPGAARPLPDTSGTARPAGVYFPSCVNRIFDGPQQGETSLPTAIVALAERAHLPVVIPSDVRGACCATIWGSKGFSAGRDLMANRVIERAHRWTDGGRLPLIVDATSCTLGLVREIAPYLSEDNRRKHSDLTIVDSVSWAAEVLLPRLTVQTTQSTVVIHPTCSMRHLGVVESLQQVAESFALSVTTPASTQCCGFAGDRGLLHRELTESATTAMAAEIAAHHYDAHLSANRMCEIGMQHATGAAYRSALLELERATRPGS